MRSLSTGRRPASLAVTWTLLLPLGLVVAIAVSGCTTTEGTNAMTDFSTFEREVMTSTLQGLSLVDKETKEETSQRRGPLVLPKDASTLPAPQQEVSVAALPKDSDSVQIDMTGLTEEDLRRLRNARVVDLRTLAGRPLTETETRQLTARMTAARIKPTSRPLYLPPDEYFTQISGQDMVCLAKDGQLVPLTDPACPPEIRRALAERASQ